MKFLILLLIVAGCASRLHPVRKDIQVTVVSANEMVVRIPEASISDIELEDGLIDQTDSKANHSVVFFKEKDHFKGISKSRLIAGQRSHLSFKIRSKDKIESVKSEY